jgi:hypothetical protein
MTVFIRHYYGEQIKKHEMGRRVVLMGKMRNPYQILVGQLESKRLLGRPRRRCEDNTKKDFKEARKGGCGLD